eukprot:TRINITY_DN18807_c0_g1_i2.p1 TRINITY_DN18807_c0_g1~~TRINITY_DN18807_c0_g1_i2.p1  ORF type:complete len:332 (+),score=61.41 TRINITY_DN18807_c0_g1_i2:278-1273(+)
MAPQIGNTVYLNPAWSAAHNQYLDDLYGCPLSALVNGNPIPRKMLAHLVQSAQQGAEHRVEIQTSTGQIPLRVTRGDALLESVGNGHHIVLAVLVWSGSIPPPLPGALEAATDEFARFSGPAPAVTEEQPKAVARREATGREKDGLQLLRYRFKEDQASDNMLLRFLRATKGDALAASERLQKTLAWRITERPERWACQYCEQTPGQHTLRQVGFDRLNRAVLYCSFVQSAVGSFTAEDTVRHWVYVMENALRSSEADSVVWLNDFSGFSINAMKPSIGKSVYRLLAEHYPEQLGVFVGVNAPSIFQFLWKGIEVILDPSTKHKVLYTPVS